MSKKFQVAHYDDTTSTHDTLEEALAEAKSRLEPWREGKDFVFPCHANDPLFASIDDLGASVFVCNNVREATDAESYITVV
jgi:hypothetical protein